MRHEHIEYGFNPGVGSGPFAMGLILASWRRGMQTMIFRSHRPCGFRWTRRNGSR